MRAHDASGRLAQAAEFIKFDHGLNLLRLAAQFGAFRSQPCFA
jgi:hypothetical protein